VEHAVRTAALALIVIAAACSIDRRTDDLFCDNGDCPDGMQCVNGFCVAMPDADDRCPGQCTTCTDLSPDQTSYETCLVDCGGSNACIAEVECPDGMECVVSCTGSNSCGNGVDCNNATACTVVCGGSGACDDGVTCGGGPCSVTCSGPNSCDAGVECRFACACDVICSSNACDIGPSCSSFACEVATGCSSAASASCDTCPD
jgi:hypothetical protein